MITNSTQLRFIWQTPLVTTVALALFGLVVF